MLAKYHQTILISAICCLSVCIIASCSKPVKSVEADTVEIDTAFFEETVEESVARDSVVKEPEGPDLKGTEKQLAFMREGNSWDRYKTGILPQMADEVPEYCEKLLKNEHPYFIIVDKNKMKLFLYDKYGNIFKSYGMACAHAYGTKHKKGDNRTADGYFTAEGIYDSTDWLYTDDSGYTSPAKGQFGPRFIRVAVPGWRCIGIHGTTARGSIGRRASHGCVRLVNENILDLVKYAQKGMPIIISPGPRDMAVNESEGYYIPSVTTEPGGTRAVAGKLAMDPSVKNEKAAQTEETEINTSLNEGSSEAPSSETPGSEGVKEGSVEPAKEKTVPEASPELKHPATETSKGETKPVASPDE